MANKSNNLPFPEISRVAQINSYYCGPASLQMLLSYLGIFVEQQQIVESLGLAKKIQAEGVTIEELGQFIHKFYPDLQFWYKFNSTIAEISQFINFYKYPIGVEWQGIFDYPDEEISEDEDDDPGHVSVITAIDPAHNFIQIADPDIHYAPKDRKFSILQFERRWWDINEIVDPINHKHQEVDDYHGLFLVTPHHFHPDPVLNLVRP